MSNTGPACVHARARTKARAYTHAHAQTEGGRRLPHVRAREHTHTHTHTHTHAQHYHRGLQDSTTMRLRSAFLSPRSTVTQPYETAFYEIRQVDKIVRPSDDTSAELRYDYPEILRGNLTVLIKIRGDNDPPVVHNPQSDYVPPAICGSMSNPSACCRVGGDQSCCQCFFGQFYAFEDTSDILEVPGMTVLDVDLQEATTEAELDVKVLAKNGNVNFNSRTGLIFYDQAFRNRKGFTASSDATNNAIRVLIYRVETPDLVNKPESTVYNYNTQQDGEEEYFDMSFNDQGYTSGIAAAQIVDTRVYVTIVALNDPPAIAVLSPDFEAVEDMLTDITGISVSDIDLMETITSSLAHELWMDDAENRQYNDAMAVEVSVEYGRMYLGVWAKLNVIRDAVQEFISLEASFGSHDLCRVAELYLKPPGSPQTFEDVCSHVNAGSSECTTGDIANKLENPNCRCGIINRCGTDKYLVMYLNRSKDFSAFRSYLKKAVIESDKSCGGLPVGPMPNNYTFGPSLCATAASQRLICVCCFVSIVPCVRAQWCFSLSHTCAAHSPSPCRASSIQGIHANRARIVTVTFCRGVVRPNFRAFAAPISPRRVNLQVTK